MLGLVAGVLAGGSAARAGEPAAVEFVLSSDATSVTAGGPLELRLTVANPGDAPVAVELPTPLHVRVETAAATAIVSLVPLIPPVAPVPPAPANAREPRADAPSGPDGAQETGTTATALVLAPGQFRRFRLRGVVPAGTQGAALLTATGLVANPLLLEVEAAPSPAPPVAAAAGSGVTEAIASDTPDPALPALVRTPRLTPRPPPLALSYYEPLYFVAGRNAGLNAKFQVAFKYRLFQSRRAVAGGETWWDDFYLGYIQTSLWDLDELSKPFRDTSYRPRLFWADYDLRRTGDGLWRFGLETGLGHESNGRDGDSSRSINFLYLRPVLTIGNPDGLRLWVAPLIYAPVDRGENPTIQQYRGYVDLLIGYGSKGHLNAWATLRQGTRRFGSLELNVSYPLARFGAGDLSGWLLLQYFDGYGESILDYDRRLPSQWRVGIALAL